MSTGTVRPEDAAAVAAVLREAGGAGRTVAIRGAGTKDAWGGPLSPVDIVLDTTRVSGVVSHEPGDRVVTVRAGTRLRDLQALLALSGQRLAVESGFVDATVGGVLAAGEAGPLRLRYGSGRDLLIGVEFVRADGVVAHSGGRVVKNVAGYDLGRLVCGSFGTVGVITQATFRLHPLPEARSWVLAPLPTLDALVAAVTAAEAVPVVPSAIEVQWSGAGTGTIAVLVEGSRAGVPARAESLRRLLDHPDAQVSGAAPAWWGGYPFGAGEVGLKLAVPVSMASRVIASLAQRLGDALTVRGSAGVGVLYAGIGAGIGADEVAAAVRGVRALLPATGGTCVVLTAPPSISDTARPRPSDEGLDMWGPVAGLPLMRRLKAQFDPAGRFAAGRFVGGL